MGRAQPPLSSESAVASDPRLDQVQVRGRWVAWTVGRPERAGEIALRMASTESFAGALDVTPPGFSVRTSWNGYGGGAFWLGGSHAFVVSDGVIHAVGLGALWCEHDDGGSHEQLGDPVPITNPGNHYADGHVAHDAPLMAALRAGDPFGSTDIEVVVAGLSDLGLPHRFETVARTDGFASSPRLSPDGSRLAWIEWADPYMPWDETRLCVMDLYQGRPAGPVVTLAGGPGTGVSVLDPCWSAAGELFWVSDESGWWNIASESAYWAGAEIEVGQPHWVFGMRRFAPIGEAATVGLIAGASLSGAERIGVQTSEGFDARAGKDDPVRVVSLDGDDASGVFAAVIGAQDRGRFVARIESRAADKSQPPRACDLVISPLDPEPAGGATEASRAKPARGRSAQHQLANTATERFDQAQPLTLETENGAVHALLRRPAWPGQTPRLILVCVHGGPTSCAEADRKARYEFWTERGVAVLDVDYRGSTGYGRRYRDALYGWWGVVDVEDTVAMARHAQDLLSDGDVHPPAVVRGSSAAGLTALLAVTHGDVFSGAISLYGAASLADLDAHSHRFEAHYTGRLVGGESAAEFANRCRERSPADHVDSIDAPILLIHGTEDRIVPMSQSRDLAAAVTRAGGDVTLVELAGEGHGFRTAAGQAQALGEEYRFVQRVACLDG